MRTVGLLLLCTRLGCASLPPSIPAAPRARLPLSLEVDGAPATHLPRAATCEGGGQAPALRWGAPPKDTAELLLVVRARSGALHWTAWGIPADQDGLPEGIVAEQAPPLQGINDAGIIGWLAPCRPPSPPDDELWVQLFALNGPLRAPPTTGVDALLQRAAPLIIGEGELRLPVWASP